MIYNIKLNIAIVWILSTKYFQNVLFRSKENSYLRLIVLIKSIREKSIGGET